MEYIIEISTTSKALIDNYSAIDGVKTSITRNLTGEAILILSAATPIATIIIKEISKLYSEKQARIRSQKLKLGKGTISFEGFTSDEIVKIISKMSDFNDDEPI